MNHTKKCSKFKSVGIFSLCSDQTKKKKYSKYGLNIEFLDAHVEIYIYLSTTIILCLGGDCEAGLEPWEVEAIAPGGDIDLFREVPEIISIRN